VTTNQLNAPVEVENKIGKDRVHKCTATTAAAFGLDARGIGNNIVANAEYIRDVEIQFGRAGVQQITYG
jgi:hypothetical protein